MLTFDSGETLLLEEEKGFCIVVDGLVQIFVKSARQTDGDGGGGAFDDEEYRDEAQGYQLLTEVKNGSPMSSLFTILSLFTEDVRLRHEDEDDGDHLSTSSSSVNLPEMSGSSNLPSPFELNGASASTLHQRRQSMHSHSNSNGYLPSIPPMSMLDGEEPRARSRSRSRKKVNSVHPDILARATVDTTIAVIPAAAFRRLTSIYPKASAHIVQVILARFQRVTFLTGYNYLGLTTEVLRTEKFMDRYTMYELPNYLRGDALDRLKEKFEKEREKSPEESKKGIVLHNPNSGRRRRSSATLRKEAAVHARVAAAKGSPSPALDTAPSPFPKNTPNGMPKNIAMPLRTPYTFSRLSRSPIPDTPLTHRAFDPFARSAAQFLGENNQSEDTAFREAVLECMFKAIGLTGIQAPGMRNGPDSVEGSPKLVSYDARKQKAMFSNAFGQLSMIDGSDTESVASTPMSAASTSGGGSIGTVHQELKDDVEIVFFPQGSVLVEQGERDPGLYYVIDGFLDVSIPVDEKMANQNNMFSGIATEDGEGDATMSPLSRTATNTSYSSAPKKKLGSKSLFMIKPGGLAGYVGSITSYRSFIDVRAKTDVYVGFLPRAAVERITEKYPIVLLTMAKRLTSLLPRLILHIDFALEWLQVPAGQVIHHQGDERLVS